MTRKWLRERSKDGWYKLAKKEGYRSRAAFKLLQLQEKFRIIREGDAIVDLGAAPGGWSQVALELTGEEGAVVGVDLAPIEPLPGAVFLRGDMTREETVAATLEALGGAADVVISDMSPNISGNYATDHARSIHLVENALFFAEKALKPGGSFTCKVFEGDMFPRFVDDVKKRFRRVRVTHPPASRKASSEAYVVGQRFRGPVSYPRLDAEDDEPEWEEGMGLPPSRKARDPDAS